MTAQRSGAASNDRTCGYARSHDRYDQLQPDHHRRVPGQRRQGRRRFAGMPMVDHHHEGRQVGPDPGQPLAASVEDDGTLYIFASKAGTPTNPDWYHNLVANPEVQVEFGTETLHRHRPRSSPAPSATEISTARRRSCPGSPTTRPARRGSSPWSPSRARRAEDPSAGEEVPAQPHEADDQDHPADRMRRDLADHVGRVRHRRGSDVGQPPEQRVPQPRSHPTPRTTPC